MQKIPSSGKNEDAGEGTNDDDEDVNEKQPTKREAMTLLDQTAVTILAFFLQQ
jgi:hypothetical protein